MGFASDDDDDSATSNVDTAAIEPSSSSSSSSSLDDESPEEEEVLRRSNSPTSSKYGILEDCGRWLLSIPRDDVIALQNTAEYSEFLQAFDRLGEAHRRTVTLERQQMEDEEEDNDDRRDAFDEDKRGIVTCYLTPQQQLQHQQPGLVTPTLRSRNNGGSNELPPLLPHTTTLAQSAISSNRHHHHHHHHGNNSNNNRRRHHSFLQHLAVDDVLLRIFEFIDCSSLVRTGTTCHRFRELTTRSAEQRTHHLAANGRLLRSAVCMLRAQEQIDGIGPREGWGPFVPIPMLGLTRRIRVSGAGDAEYDGIYFCTGCNGNGFLFTKPRYPQQRVRTARVVRVGGDDDIVGLGGGAWWMNINNNNNNNNNNNHNNHNNNNIHGIPDQLLVAARGVLVGNNVINDNRHALVPNLRNGDIDEDDENNDEDNNNNNNAAPRDGNSQPVTSFFGDEPNRNRLLRCVISKRYSNENIFWYMSKEVEDEMTNEVSQSFIFWARLQMTEETTPDVCQYPSQTNILSRNGDPAWQPLSTTLGVAPPMVELLD